MNKLKVMTILGTRPEIIRLSRVMAKLDRHCEHVIVHTGQNFDWELNGVFFEQLAVRRPDVFLESARPSAAATIGQIIADIDPVLERYRPDAVLILGDTNSSLAAIAVKRRKIPIFHMEAGNRSFDQRVPEEINRRIVDHLADINLTYSEIAREYLLREGFAPDRVIRTGSPMKEVLTHYRAGIDASPVMAELGLAPGGFYVVSAHREENVDDPARLRRLADVVNRLAASTGRRVVFSVHPRTRARIEAAGVAFDAGVILSKPFGFLDYVQLQINAKAVLSDSGTITEESSILGFPALNLREAHERPEGNEQAAVMMTPLDGDAVERALAVLEAQQASGWAPQIVGDYDVDDVSDKLVRIIHSYVQYVNTFVWRRDRVIEGIDR